MKANEEFTHHAARAFFACAWATQQEENGTAPAGEIMEQMPDEIDAECVAAAENLLDIMLAHNGGADAADLLDRCPDEGCRPHTLEMLGHYAAMQAMGHGVGLGDAFGDHDCLYVPHIEEPCL